MTTDLISKLTDPKSVDVDLVLDEYITSDSHKWGDDSERAQRAKSQFASYKWVVGSASFNELLDVELTPAGWAKELTTGCQKHTVRYALEHFSERLHGLSETFEADYKILIGMIECLKSNSFPQSKNFVIIGGNRVDDGNHRILTIPHVRGKAALTKCYVGF